MNLTEAKIGDIVVYGPYGNISYGAKVEKITKTQLTLDDGSRFLLSTGKKVGSSGWNSSHGKLASEADLAKLRLKKRIKNASFKLHRLQVDENNIDAIESMFITINKELP